MTSKKPPMAVSDKPLLIPGNLYRVTRDHQFFANRTGIFQFYGGPKKDVVVLAKPAEEPLVLFCVSVNDILTGL